MNSDISTIVKQNLDYVRDNGLINLDFVYLQLDNVSEILGNEQFINELKDLVNQVLDRDDNGVFDSNDIELLRDIFSKKQTQVLNIYNFIMEIFNSVLALIAKVDEPVLKLSTEAIEGIFFGVFSYILFQYGTMSDDDKQVILDILVAVYSTLETVDNTLGVSQKLLNLLKKKGWCKCLYDTSTDASSTALEKEILRSKLRVKELSLTMKETEKLHRKVYELERRLNGE